MSTPVGSPPNLIGIGLIRSATNIEIGFFQWMMLTIPMLIVATLWYLAVTTVLTIGQFFIERHFSRSSRQQPQGTPVGRFLRKAFTFHDKSRKEAAA